MPQGVTLVVYPAALVDQDLAAGVQIPCIEQLGPVEAGDALAKQPGRMLELAQQAAEGNMRSVFQRRGAKHAHRITVHRCDDRSERVGIDGPGKIHAADFGDEGRANRLDVQCHGLPPIAKHAFILGCPGLVWQTLE